MVGVIIHWDHKPKLDHVGKRNLFQHYDYVCRAYKVDKLVIVDVNGTMDLNPPHDVVGTLDEALALFPGTPACYVHPLGNCAVNAPGLIYPPDMVYVLGADFEALELPKNQDSLFIPVADTGLELWADQALAIVLAARFMREGTSK